MKKTIQKIINEEISNISLETLLSSFRDKMEKKFNRNNFGYYCGEISTELSKFLNKNGLKTSPVWGQYCGASLQYAPDTNVLNNDEDFDEDTFWSDYEEAQDNGKSLCYAHWWVKTDDGYVLDITADQFHPNEKDKYRIIITKSNENYQEYS